jgi:hypothetical protein
MNRCGYSWTVTKYFGDYPDAFGPFLVWTIDGQTVWMLT